MEVLGRVKVINPVQQVSASFKKREVVVTTDEQYPQHISIDSPMARALLSKQVDDEVEVLTPSGKKLWYINQIHYEKHENLVN